VKLFMLFSLMMSITLTLELISIYVRAERQLRR